mgnify:CR=1 FL=1
MTIMARTRSLSSIETEISKVTAELQKAQEKVDELTQRLLELQEQKQSIEVNRSWMPSEKAVKVCRN